MSKQEYMSKLIEALSEFDADIREEIINDYEDHFVNGLKSGKTEDEIAEELGSIEELVSDLNALSGKGEAAEGAEKSAEENAQESEESAKINDMIKNFATFIGEMAAGISKGSRKVSSKAVDGAKDFAGGAKDFANNFTSAFMKGYENFAQGVGNMADKVKKSDFAQGISKGYKDAMNKGGEDEAAKDEDVEDLDDFDIDIDVNTETPDRSVEEGFDGADGENFDLDEEENAEFVRFSDDIENVVIEVESAEVYLDTSDDNTLNINYENDGNPNQKLAYHFECKQKGRTLYASVKKQTGLSNFFKSLGCPDISLYVGLSDNVKKVSVKTMSGEVTANEIDAEQFSVKSMSGDINVEGCRITIAELQTMSGDINVTLEDAKSVSMSSISGDLEFDGICESIHAKTTSGDVDLKLDNANSDLTVSSISGDVNVELPNDTGYVANVKSTSGSITLNCGDEEKEVTRSGNYILGDGGARLTLSSISGDIDVDA